MGNPFEDILPIQWLKANSTVIHHKIQDESSDLLNTHEVWCEWIVICMLGYSESIWVLAQVFLKHSPQDTKSL